MPVRIEDIANRLGISKMTVSRALRGVNTVSPRTRKRVETCAEEMGYHKDPALSALAVYRHRGRQSPGYSQIAFVTNYPRRNERRWNFVLSFLEGARMRGRFYGYDVAEFWLPEGGRSHEQASSILYHRGIRGLLIAPLPVEGTRLNLTWEHFTSVAIGMTLASPRLHYAAFDHYGAMQTVYRSLIKKGYSRIGYVYRDFESKRMRHMSLSAYLGEQRESSQHLTIPPFCDDTYFTAKFWRWVSNYKPDALITSRELGLKLLQEKRFLAKRRRIGIACLTRRPYDSTELAGMVEDWPEIGAVAMDRLHSHLLRREYGLPDLPQGTLLEGRWWEGSSC